MLDSALGLAWDVDTTTCIGFGASICFNAAKTEGLLRPYFAFSVADLEAEEDTTSAAIVYSYDYTTSDDIEKAGLKSDMFLTPSLNVKFSKSAEIGFNLTTCAATSKEIITWSLDSETNVPVCMVLTTCRVSL